jgi:BirA family transcriptional regulator, biotin operon repressor / biotin---[acetyl-CoA-carboxylase] ligase
MPAPEPLSGERLRADLGDAVIGNEIVVLEQTTSTNDAVLRLAISETAEGLVVFAEHQTAGRGQRGNVWESAAGQGLWFSILLRPKIDIDQSARLTKWAAKTVAQTIEQELTLPAAIKSPNDVYVDGRKVAGILVEMRARKQESHIAVVGIGVNVNHGADDFPPELRASAGSLALAVGHPLDPHPLAVALLRNLDRSYAELFAG